MVKILLETINIKINNGVLIYEDNNGCITITSNPSSHRLAKPIDIKYHYSRHEVQEGSIRLKHFESENQIADILTRSNKIFEI